MLEDAVQVPDNYRPFPILVNCIVTSYGQNGTMLPMTTYAGTNVCMVPYPSQETFKLFSTAVFATMTKRALKIG